MNDQEKELLEKMMLRKMFVYFSQLLDREVLDKNKVTVGEVYDIIVKPTQVYPQSSALIVRKGFPNRKYALIEWRDIVDIDAESRDIHLSIDSSRIVFHEKHDNKEELTLRRDILDQQVVDTHNHKVIRINDIHLLFVDHAVMVAHVDISNRGLIRRLGFEKAVDFIVRLINPDADYLKVEYLISWKFIQPLSINPASMTIKVDVPEKQFSSIPAADLGDIFLDLNIMQQVLLFKSLDAKTKAKVFTHIDFKTQKLLVEELKPGDVVEILNNIPSDEATDFLERLPKKDTVSILSLMESSYSRRLSQLLGYSNDSAGGLMVTEYIFFTKGTTVDSAFKQIKERTFKVEPAQFVYVVDDGNKLIGCTNFRRMILADPQEPIQNVIFPKLYSVRLDSSVKEVAYLMEKYKYYTIPVVDDNGVLQGIVTVDDVLSQVIAIAWRRFKNIKVAHSQ